MEVPPQNEAAKFLMSLLEGRDHLIPSMTAGIASQFGMQALVRLRCVAGQGLGGSANLCKWQLRGNEAMAAQVALVTTAGRIWLDWDSYRDQLGYRDLSRETAATIATNLYLLAAYVTLYSPYAACAQ